MYVASIAAIRPVKGALDTFSIEAAHEATIIISVRERDARLAAEQMCHINWPEAEGWVGHSTKLTPSGIEFTREAAHHLTPGEVAQRVAPPKARSVGAG